MIFNRGLNLASNHSVYIRLKMGNEKSLDKNRILHLTKKLQFSLKLKNIMITQQYTDQHSDEQKELAELYKKKLDESGAFRAPIVTEISPTKTFYAAEDYHQNYEKINPNNPYVQQVSIPRLNRFKKKFPELLKEEAKLHQGGFVVYCFQFKVQVESYSQVEQVST